MTHPNLGPFIAAVWEQLMHEMPDLLDEASERLYDDLSGHRKPYRYWLDRQPRNTFGELIPRIVTVRHNLRRLGNIRLDPNRLV